MLDRVGRTVALAVELGVLGCNIEDAGNGRLFAIDEAVSRLAAARASAPSGTFALNARTGTYFGGGLARAALRLVDRAARELLDHGTLGFLDGAIRYSDLQRRFGVTL